MKTKWQDETQNEDAIRDALNRILASEGEIVPSSGFAASVMDVIAAEKTAPPPLSFPWRLAIPGLAAMGAAIFAMVRLGMEAASASQADLALMNSQALHGLLYSPGLRLTVGPLAAALLASCLGLWLARKLSGASAVS